MAARPVHKLTPEAVLTLGPGRHADGLGLYLYVTDSRSWLFRYACDKKQTWVGLGSLAHALRQPTEKARMRAAAAALAQARAQAEGLNIAKDRGQDPLALMRAKRMGAKYRETLPALAAPVQADSRGNANFKACAEACYRSVSVGFRNAKHSRDWLVPLKEYAFPIVGQLNVADVETSHIVDILRPHWTTKTETMSRTRAKIERVLDYARTTGLRSGDNPARWKGHLEHVFAAPGKITKVAHHPALPWKDIAAFMTKLNNEPGMAPLALKFTILTVARTSEVLGAKWAEISISDRIWTVPATRMKMGREHRIPLSKAALAVLNEAAQHGTEPDSFIFKSNRPGRGLGSMSMLSVLRDVNRSDITVHGFRSSFRDWAAEMTDFPDSLAELSLAHVAGSTVERAYKRGDLLEKRRELMTGWGQFVTASKRETLD